MKNNNNKTTRREFITKTGIATVGVTLGASALKASVIVDHKSNNISVFARDYNSIRWISGISGSDSTRTNKVIAEGDATFNYKHFDKSYIRFELKNDKGTTLSQPFGFSISN